MGTGRCEHEPGYVFAKRVSCALCERSRRQSPGHFGATPEDILVLRGWVRDPHFGWLCPSCAKK